MRRLALLPVLLITLLLGACDDITGPSRRALDGEWTARVDGELVWVSIRDDRGYIRGSGEWGRDDIYVSGDRRDRDVWLVFEFDRYNPVEFEGRLSGRELEGRLHGSGYDGVRVRFRRD